MQRLSRVERWGVKSFLVAGSVLTFLALVFLVRTAVFLSDAVRVEASVIKNETTYSDEGNPLYQPTFFFRDGQGSGHTVRLHYSSSEYGYNEDDRVSVLYDPDDPQTIRIDSFFGIWLLTVVFGFIGICFLVTSLVALRSRKAVPAGPGE